MPESVLFVGALLAIAAIVTLLIRLVRRPATAPRATDSSPLLSGSPARRVLAVAGLLVGLYLLWTSSAAR
jgi:hypothetical protein